MRAPALALGLSQTLTRDISFKLTSSATGAHLVDQICRQTSVVHGSGSRSAAEPKSIICEADICPSVDEAVA